MNARLRVRLVCLLLLSLGALPFGARAAFTSNQPPVAVNDFVTVTSGVPKSINVLTNDYDPNFDPISISSFTQPTFGFVNQSGTQLVYQSFAAYCGPDSFSYAISDGHGGFSSNAFVSVTVTCGPSNQNPVAVGDFATVGSGSNITISVLANDSDPNGDPLSISAFTQPLHGSVFQSGTQLVYQSASPYCGADSFTYTIIDGHGGSASTNVSVTVNCAPSNQPPVAVNDSATVASGVSTLINVLANDYDPDFNPISIWSYGQPLHGSVFQSGGLYYQSFSGYAGPDSFSYTITDNNGGYSSNALVSITVTNPPASADVSMTKYSSAGGPVTVGDQITYTLYAYNAGPSTSTNVIVRDAIPTGTVFVSASGGACTYYPNFQRVDCDVGDLPAFNSAFVYVTVQVTGTGPIINFANAYGTTFDPNTTNNTHGLTNTAVTAQADVSMQKSGPFDPVTVGDQITYTLYAYNAGPSTSTNVIVRDAIPTGTVYVSASGGACTYYPNFQRVDCDVGSLPPGIGTYVYVTVQVTNTGSIVNFANAYGSTPDPNTTNNASGVTNISITASADVSMTKYSSAAGSVMIGDQITYTLYAYNYGPSTSSNVVVRDAIPTGTVFVSASGGACTYYPNFQRVDCDVGNLSPGGAAYVYVTVQVTNTGSIVNFANAYGSTPDPNTTNNASGVTNTAISTISADVSLTKYSSWSNTVQVGQQIIYTLAAFNGGPYTSTNVIIRDTIPAGTSYVGASGGACTFNPGLRRVDCSVANLVSGGQATVYVTVQVNATGSLVNCASAFGDTPDTNTLNNTSCVTNTGVTAQADLSLTKYTSTTNTLNIGSQIIYTLGAFNGGPSLASNVVIRDTLPAGVALVSVTGTANSYSYDTNLNRLDVNMGNLGVAAAPTVYVTVNVTALAGTLLNCANIFSDMGDSNPTNNTACVTNNTSLPSADLRVTKTASTNSVPVGSDVVFNLTLRNTGPSSVTNQIIVSEVIPSGYDYVGDNSAGSGNYYSFGLGQWVMPTGIVVGATQTVAITLRAINPGVYTNTAIVNVPNGITDPITNNNVSSAVVTNTLPLADLQITKTASASPVLVGDTVVFNLTLRNNGPATVTNQVVVSEVIPSGYDYVGDNSTGTGNYYSFGLGQWVMPTGIVANATQTVAITLRAIAIGTYTNRAIIMVPPDVTDPNTNNNVSSAVVTNIQPVADLQITKTASTNRAIVGQSVVFNLTLRNVGPDAVTNAFYVDDVLPSGYYYVSNAASAGTAYSLGQGRWLFFTGVPANTTQTLAITTLAITNGVFTNTAIINPPANLNDPNTNNNSASVIVTNVLPQADLSVVKFLTVSNVNVHVGEQVSFTIIVSNAGPQTVSNLLVPDFPDVGLMPAFVGHGTNVSFNSISNTFTITNLAAGQSVQIELCADVTGVGLLTNRITVPVPPGFADTNLTNNASFAYVNSTPASDLQITKTANVASTNFNRPITFTIVLRNGGPNVSSNMVVQDLNPPGTTLISSNVPADTTFNPATGQWTVPLLTNGETRTLQLTLRHPTGATVTNTALVLNSPHYDPTPNDRTNSVVAVWLPIDYADLALTIALQTNFVTIGQTSQVQFVVNNLGTDPASNITVSVPLPPGVQVVNVPANPDWSYNTNTAVWTRTNTLNTFAPSAFTYDVRATNAGLKTFTAQITASQPYDPYLSNNIATTNFIAGTLVNITGVVKCATNGPSLAGVTITATTSGGPTRQTVTGPAGTFSFTNLPAGTYTITPTTNGFSFAPTNQTVTVASGATNLPLFLAIVRNISGLVRTGTNGSVLSGVTVQLSGAATATQLTDVNGAFNFTNLNPGTYIVTPLTNTQPYARFTPTNATFVLSNPTNWTNGITFYITNSVVVLRALEVVQVSQDWLNSVPLIANKDTLLRAHLQLLGTNTTPVDMAGARLWATNLATGASTSWAPTNHVIVMSNNAAYPPLRSNIATTLDFPLPAPWRAGRMEYRLEWTNGVLVPREPAEFGGIASNGSVRVTYTNMPDFGVRFVKVAWTNNAGVTNIPTDAQIDEQRRRVISIYPIVRFEALDGYFFWSRTNGAPTNEGNLLPALDAARITSTDTNGTATNRIWYGVIANQINRGLAYLQRGTGVGNLSAGANDFQRHLAAHEIGHTLMRPHAVHASLGRWRNAAGVLVPGTTTGACQEQAWNPVTNFPMFVTARFGGALVPTLGPMTLDDEFVWGYDHYLQQVISPHFTYDVMSYCHNFVGTTPWPWMSKYTYTNIQNAIINRFGTGGAPPPALHQLVKSMSPYMLLRGEINLVADTMQFFPSYPLAAGALPDPVPGDYVLRLIDGLGQPLLEIPFTPDVAQIEFDHEPAFGHFNIEAPVLPSAVGAIVFHSGVPIGTIGATAHAPTVQLFQPNGGEVFGNNGIHSLWSGNDADGDALHYLVQFSPDGGLQWTTISIDWDGSALDIPPDVLAATSHGKLRVTASDGFRFTTDESDGEFVILNHGPAVAITAPAAGDTFFGELSIAFTASAHDFEDGALTGTNLVWRSDRDGFLGTSDLLLREVSTLSEGAHVITVTATDSGGMTNSATVTINVSHQEPPQLNIVTDGSDALLWWSLTATNYHLQRALVLPGVWNNVTNAVELLEDRAQVRVPAVGPRRYFRLTKP